MSHTPEYTMFHDMDDIIVSTFGIPATYYPQTGGSLTIYGSFLPPAVLEDLMPGLGADVVRFFCQFHEIDPAPAHGDVIEIDEDVYDVYEIEVDSVGGGVLKLRKKR